MQDWILLSLRIGTFGFLKEFRPEDPYITQYLIGPVMNFNETTVNQQVFPIATYVSLFDLIWVFLLTDYLRYKPIIAVNALCGVISQGILIWCRSLRAIQVMEVFYGTMSACEVAYYTYIYAKVDKEHYQAVTSHMRAAALTGRFTSGMTAQLCLLFGILDIAQLNHLTFIGMIAALLWAISLPSMKHSLYFHKKPEVTPIRNINTTYSSSNENRHNQEESELTNEGKCSRAARQLMEDFLMAYTNPYVIKWSLWWALATCCYQQVMSYVQLLWNEIGNTENTVYNGAVEATYTIISAFSAFMFGKWKADWSRPDRGELLLGVLTLVEGCVLLWSSQSHAMWQAYIVYITFGALYHVMMTVSNSEVARHIPSDSYALIFGVNTFVALILQTVLTFTVAADGGLGLPIRTQFVVYGSYFCVLGIVFLLKCISSFLFPSRNKTS